MLLPVPGWLLFWRWGHHYSWSTFSFFYLDTISPSLARIWESLKLSIKCLRYGGGEEAALLWLWCFRCLQLRSSRYCCSSSGCYLLSSLLTPIAKNLPPTTGKVVGENLCSCFSCFSANSPSLWKSSSGIQIQLPHGSLAQEFKLRCWTLKSWGMCLCRLLLGVDLGRGETGESE